ncbi:universal stress protein [Sphaerotilaceae bacterium SBD11-9]
MKILLAVDGSEFTKQMLAYLAAHDELLGANNQYTVLTVVPPVPPQVTHFVTRDSIDGYYEERGTAVLAPINAFAAQKGWNIASRREVGNPAEVISSIATAEKFDMVILGSHGHSTLGSLVMGSVASGVLARCKTPMLIIR